MKKHRVTVLHGVNLDQLGKRDPAVYGTFNLPQLEGSVTLGGVDARRLDPGELRRAVRLAPQDAYLFATTIRANVAIARPEASDAEIAEALARAGLGPWLAELPDGLDTLVGELGAAVSGGQRQRIAMARLLLADARFLIFDEPTSHLDFPGHVALQQVLTSWPGGLVVASHDEEFLNAIDLDARVTLPAAGAARCAALQ